MRDLTPEIEKLREKELKDPRPWYQKRWPYMLRNQHIKIIPDRKNGTLAKCMKDLMKIASRYRRIVAKEIKHYNFMEKLIVIKEITAETEPYEYEEGTEAKIIYLKDKDGNILEFGEDNERIKKGEYLLIYIGMFTDNWNASLLKTFEHSIVHELLHVVDPEIGFYKKGALTFENEKLMEKLTQNFIDKHKLKRSRQRV